MQHDHNVTAGNDFDKSLNSVMPLRMNVDNELRVLRRFVAFVAQTPEGQSTLLKHIQKRAKDISSTYKLESIDG